MANMHINNHPQRLTSSGVIGIIASTLPIKMLSIIMLMKCNHNSENDYASPILSLTTFIIPSLNNLNLL